MDPLVQKGTLGSPGLKEIRDHQELQGHRDLRDGVSMRTACASVSGAFVLPGSIVANILRLRLKNSLRNEAFALVA